MNGISVLILKSLRFGYERLFNYKIKCAPIRNIEGGGDKIYNILMKQDPCMVARFGATEIACILNYLSIQKQDKNLWRYIKGETKDWWWNRKIMVQMQKWSGFFPPNEEKLTRFCELMLSDSKDVDILALFSNTIEGAISLKPYMRDDLEYISLVSFDSFLSDRPWSRCLKNKKVLVVHPFASLIEKQYLKRKFLFSNPDVLPDFELRTIEAVQSLGGVNHGFSDWFNALDWMKGEMDKEPYEIALIGCGAYGFPLAAYAKKTGHKAVHIGGSLQLLFGIKGGRWEKPDYALAFGLSKDTYIKLFDNPHWVRPSEYRTKESDNVENACYW